MKKLSTIFAVIIIGFVIYAMFFAPTCGKAGLAYQSGMQALTRRMSLMMEGESVADSAWKETTLLLVAQSERDAMAAAAWCNSDRYSVLAEGLELFHASYQNGDTQGVKNAAEIIIRNSTAEEMNQ